MTVTDRPDDTALIDAARAGDRAAMDRLLRRHHDLVRAVCRRVTGSAADADDATQEALIKIVRSLDRFDGRSAFSTWCYRIATNASLDELRRKGRRPRPQAIGGGDDDAHLERADLVGDDVYAHVADRSLLDGHLAALPEEFRLPVVLRDVGDLDYREIADTLGIPIGTVKSRIARGRTMLAKRIGNRAGSPERRTNGRRGDDLQDTP